MTPLNWWRLVGSVSDFIIRNQQCRSMPCVTLATEGPYICHVSCDSLRSSSVRTCVRSNPDDNDDGCQLWCRDHDDEVLGSLEYPFTMTILVPKTRKSLFLVPLKRANSSEWEGCCTDPTRKGSKGSVRVEFRYPYHSNVPRKTNLHNGSHTWIPFMLVTITIIINNNNNSPAIPPASWVELFVHRKLPSLG